MAELSKKTVDLALLHLHLYLQLDWMRVSCAGHMRVDLDVPLLQVQSLKAWCHCFSRPCVLYRFWETVPLVRVPTKLLLA